MKYLFLLLATAISLPVAAQSVVATTGWTAAYASAAGVPEVLVLAPYEMTHPPEYELKPSDIARVARADLVLYAGYEVMVGRLLESTENSAATALRIRTGYTREILAESILAIASVAGDEAVAVRSLEELHTALESWAESLQPTSAIVHVHQAGLAEELGIDVLGVFGPGPLEARQISELTRLDPDLIIDNGHNPIASAVAETTGAPVARWINFPGAGGSRTLIDVLAFNRAEMARAIREHGR